MERQSEVQRLSMELNSLIKADVQREAAERFDRMVEKAVENTLPADEPEDVK